ncbi:short-chain dehydrogenase [Prauserella marina]|uniref:Short-chain dehydrogenase n=1 Tax=Prauserella marina TaxID=530584 RepID=A0A222VXN3_9PSEU|nr:short-chain dehydrogenase [Prauserella marina]PWV78295.1 short-subunit dehydrogenase [Prauserella marina]SDC82799.1 Short-chain dehydrogenase [Prauserella marina]
MGKVAIVTGGASGIGKALCTALAARGVNVVVADLDAEAAGSVARGLRGSAFGRGVDVTSASSVDDLVNSTAEEHGRLDFLFNNAGIGMGGDAEELVVAHWDRTIDVNLRGVVHGVCAAYPLMVRQGFGHIVNVASVGGLIPEPLATPYAASKFGVVGLSLSLRAEAADRGVSVSVVCPGVIETPIYERGIPGDLPAIPSTEVTDVRAAFLRTAGGRMYPAAALAEDVLRGLARDKAVIVAPRRARMQWLAARFAPNFTLRAAQAITKRERRLRGDAGEAREAA